MKTEASQQMATVLTEQDLAQVPDPDFAIRMLDQYKAQDLEHLMVAVNMSAANKVLTSQERNALDVWGYRIRDAWKEARRREEPAR